MLHFQASYTLTRVRFNERAWVQRPTSLMRNVRIRTVYNEGKSARSIADQHNLPNPNKIRSSPTSPLSITHNIQPPYPLKHTSHPLLLLPLLLLSPPIPKTLAPNPRNTLPPRPLPNRLLIPLVHNPRRHQRQHKHPDITSPHPPPPPPLNTHLPKTIHARPSRVQERRSPVPPLHKRPQTRRKAGEEEALRREDVLREVRLRQADRAPRRRKGARDKGGRAEGAGDQAVEGGERVVVEVL